MSYSKETKEYKCNKCNITMNKPYVRFVMQKYGKPCYNMDGDKYVKALFYNIDNYDLCKTCYTKLLDVYRKM